jgi:Transposase DNA-binding
MMSSGLCSSWSQKQFERAPLGDPRRTRRVQKIGEAMARKPGQSIPQLFDTAYDVIAAYDLFNREEATPMRLQYGHRELVHKGMREPGSVILLLEDTTTFSWSGNKAVDGLGPIGDGSCGQQGFLAHTVLAVKWHVDQFDQESRRPPVTVLGLADQYYHVRDESGESRKGEKRKDALSRWRESMMWSESTERLQRPPDCARWIRINDAEADIYEHLENCQEYGHGFVIRACKDRTLEGCGHHLFEAARAGMTLGQFKLKLRSRDGQPEREAQLELSVCKVTLQPPWRPKHGGLPIELNVLHVHEVHAAPEIEPLEWILLTDSDVQTFESALQVALQYSARWLIEEYHKVVKTGLGAEKLQLETADRLMAAIAIMCVVACRLLELRERARREPQACASQSGLSCVELRVLSAKAKKQLVTVSDVALAIGRLGGHMNRKRDGLPGWMTLWRGLMVLDQMTQGFRLAQELQTFD